MKVAIVSTYDIEGGAAIAAYRLHQSLRQAGVESTMFVQQKLGTDPSVHGPGGNLSRLAGRLRWRLDHLPAQLAGARRGEFAVNWCNGGIAHQLRAFAPDVVHLHWINAGYVGLGELLTLRRPLVWTAHDMWPFTGGCHYDRGCGAYALTQCQTCPMQVRFPRLPLASRGLRRKAGLAAAAHIAYVTPSRWLAGVARASPVGQASSVRVIPNAIDTSRFKPMDRAAARSLFGLPQDRTVLLFGGLLSNRDPRKGFALLDKALALIAGQPDGQAISLCVYGTAVREDFSLYGVPVKYVGHLHDDEALIALYSAADVFVAPSLQDNLPNTVLEAAACGLPTVAFDIGGMGDLIEHSVSGWLAAPGDVAALAEGLLHAVRHRAWRSTAGQAARAHVLRGFAAPVVAQAHLELYHEVISEGHA